MKTMNTKKAVKILTQLALSAMLFATVSCATTSGGSSAYLSGDMNHDGLIDNVEMDQFRKAAEVKSAHQQINQQGMRGVSNTLRVFKQSFDFGRQLGTLLNRL